MELPPGQRAVRGFPRFGIDRVSPPPRAPEGMNIEVSGQLARRVSLDLDELTRLPRREVAADFHCVAGWSTANLRWEGVPFNTVYRESVAPRLAPGTRTTSTAPRLSLARSSTAASPKTTKG